MKPKKKFKKRYVVIPVVLILVIAFVVNLNSGKQSMMYAEETASVRDIVNYLEFSGSVTAAEEKNIFAQAATTVTEVMVEEGDAVKKGDVICTLDSSDVEYSIEAKELSIAQANTQNYYNLKDAKTNLANLEDSLAKGMNSSVNAAQKSLLAAQEQFYLAAEQYNSAQKSYLEANADLQAEKTSSIVSAKNSLQSAQGNLEEWEFQYRNLSEEDREKNLVTDRISVSQAQANLQTARENAKKQVEELEEAAKQAYDKYEKAEEDLAAAQRDYEVTLYSIEQNKQSYKDTIEKLQATMSTESSELDLEHTRESLEDYVVYAPIDGYVTSLSVKQDERISGATPIGVITNFDEMEISINIDEYDIAFVKEGSPVEIYINALDTYYDGEIKSIAKTATKTGDVSYIKATVSFAPTDVVMCGLSAEVKLIKSNEKNAITVSEACISYDDSHSAYVLIKGEDGIGVPTAVTLGASDGNYVQILSGVKENDVILYVPNVLMPYQMMMNVE